MTALRLPNVNFVMLAGRLTRDPDVRYLPSGKAVVRLSVASSRRFLNKNTNEWQEEVVFVDVTVWGDAAQRSGERLRKGSPVFVEGRLKLNKWEAKDGTKHSKIEIDAQRIQFLEVAGPAEQANAPVGIDTESSIGAAAPVETEATAAELEEVAL
ncbi:MAG: single-stranded DNA-binding protein [Elusimicrobia bacterium]|nr:single-stranded DNA-binding protein [Elusimicrobiota bacterium]